MPRRQASKGSPASIFAESASPVFLVNGRRQFRLFNSGCERETGWSAAELAEQRADFVTDADLYSAGAVAAALAPPPEVWEGRALTAPVALPHRSEGPRPRLVHFFPLTDDEQNVSAVLGIITAVFPPESTTALPIVQTLHAELAALRHSLRQQFGERTLLARSPKMFRVLRQVKVAQAVTAPVLLIGEAGVGREHIARVIHYAGPRGRQSFVPFDCAAVDPLELKRSLRHLMEEAGPAGDSPMSPGAVYFSKVEAAPVEVLQRLAEFVETDPPVRIIAGCTQHLESAVEVHQFPRELYYRLTSLVIEVPPLRERVEDLGPLAQLFLEELNRDADQQVSGFSEEVWEQFRRFQWPGNLDELRVVIAEARQTCTGTLILPEDLPFRFRTGVDSQKSVPRQRPKPVALDALLEQTEKEQIELAIAETRGNISQAAELLDIPRARLYRRLQQLGIQTGSDSGLPERDFTGG